LSDEASRKSRTDLCEIIDFVLENIDPINIIGKAVELRTSKLFIKNDLVCDISDFKNIFVLGAGKAAYKMALAMENLLGYKVSKGYVNVPDLPEKNALRKIQINRASHPIPDQGGLNGAQEIMKLAKEAGADDLIICLISGGGSSLLPLPVVPLEEFIELNSLLLKSPATINEINAVRKHLSQISGGNLAVAAYPARLLSLIISDVVNDPLDVIASGPTVPDLSRFQEAIEVLKKYNLKRGYFLSVATLEPRKNLKVLLNVYLRGQFDKELVIVGAKGWGDDEIHKLVMTNHQVRMLGYIPDEELPILYRGASCFIYPSFYEGFGLPVLEAMTFSIPTICSNTSSLTEVGGDAVLYIDPKSEESIKEAIGKIENDDNLKKRLIEKGLQQADKFSWRKSAEKLNLLYQQL